MTIKKGAKVKVEYTGTLDDGSVFDSTTHGDHTHPLEFEIGAGKVIPGFENAIKEMSVGDEREIHIPSAEAYGDARPELVQKVPRDKMPEGIKDGMIIGVTLANGAQIPAKVISVDEKDVTIDLNHPLAGKNLNFKLKLVEVN